MQTIFKHKTIIIGILIVIVSFVAYSFYVSGKKDTTTTVTKQAVTNSSAQASIDGPGKEFVTQLLAIQNINFKLDFFKDPVYIGLQDFSREIKQQPVGRPNPFAPFGDESRLNSPVSVSDINISTATTTSRATANTGTSTTTRANQTRR